jgi:nitroreductase
MHSQLSVDDVRTTTRAVRKRLDFTRPVERHVIEECLAAAQQAPNEGNLHTWGFGVITDGTTRAEGLPTALQYAIYGSIMPAAWSFRLAARARGLGTCWTMFHLYHEEEAAKLLGIPYGVVMQVALIPVAHVRGPAFRPGSRQPVQTMIHWET